MSTAVDDSPVASGHAATLDDNSDARSATSDACSVTADARSTTSDARSATSDARSASDKCDDARWRILSAYSPFSMAYACANTQVWARVCAQHVQHVPDSGLTCFADLWDINDGSFLSGLTLAYRQIDR